MQDIEFIPIPRQSEQIEVEVDRLVYVVNRLVIIIACILSLIVGAVVGILLYVVL